MLRFFNLTFAIWKISFILKVNLPQKYFLNPQCDYVMCSHVESVNDQVTEVNDI